MSERAQYWRRMVAAWERSGLSQAAFCRERDIKPVTFGGWKRKLVGAARKRRRGRSDAGRASRKRHVSHDPTATATGFVEIPLGHSGSAGPDLVPGGGHVVMSPGGYEVVWPGGPTIRLPHAFDPDRVTRLVLALQSSC